MNMKSTQLCITEYSARKCIISITCFLAILFMLSPVFSQNARSSANSVKKKTTSGKNRAATTKKSSRRQKKRVAKQLDVEISNPAPTKPYSLDKDLRTLPQIGPPASEKNRDNEEVEREPPFFGEKKALPGVIELPYIQPEQPLFPKMPAPSVNFAGLDFAGWGNGFPPDTVGDVGRKYYIQAVNTSFAIYTKTGTRLVAMTFNNFWYDAAAGTPCAANHQGDPTVIFDGRYGGRWIVADFAYTGSGSTPPFYECIAVSKTGNPVSGGWWLYAIRADDAAHPWLADYPKMGMWHNALHMTANMFQGATFKGARIWAFKFTDLIAGLPVGTVVVDLPYVPPNEAHFSLLPANYRGVSPSSARPEYIIGESTVVYGFNIFQFKPNFGGTSTFTVIPTVVSQTSYDLPAGNNPTPSSLNPLDTVQGDHLKMQAQYRRRGSKESLWVSHSARPSPTSPNGIQWAEIDVTGGTINTTPLHQQIYANLSGDGLSRWMSSLAADWQGNMLLGYSASSSTSNPSIRYNGRLASNPLDTLDLGEAVMQTGGGTLTGNCGSGPCKRWGDYAAMTVDPSDHCTFWFTTLYYTANQLGWNTRIGSVKFPSCAPPGPYDGDHDGIPDPWVVGPGSGGVINWRFLLTSSGEGLTTGFGTAGDKITPADFSGDGVTDIAVFRPSTGEWFVLRSEDDSFYSFTFGTSGDIPLPANYDGDGIADPAVFRPSNSNWFILPTEGEATAQQFGASGDKPVPADYDGDGKTDIAVFRPSTGTWWVSTALGAVFTYQFGNSTDKLVPADYTADGKADAAVFRPSTGEWFVLRSENLSYYSAPYGLNGDIPVPLDYDGDGKIDFAVFRPSNSTWYALRSSNGSSLIIQFGNPGDIPVQSAYVQ